MSWHDVIHETLAHEGIAVTDEQIDRIAESCAIHERESASLRSERHGNPEAYQESQRLRETKQYYEGEAKNLTRIHDEKVADLERQIRFLERQLRDTAP